MQKPWPHLRTNGIEFYCIIITWQVYILDTFYALHTDKLITFFCYITPIYLSKSSQYPIANIEELE